LALVCGGLVVQVTGLSGYLGLFLVVGILMPVFVGLLNLKRGANVVIDRLASAVIAVAFVAVTIPWFSIFFTVFQKGSEAFHSSYLTDDMRITPSGDDLQYGGIAHAIVGTMLMVLVATVISVPFGIIAAVYIVEVKGRFAGLIRFLVQAMSGVPSIVAGLFVYSTVVIFFGGFSAWAGAVALSILMLPTVTHVECSTRRDSGSHSVHRRDTDSGVRFDYSRRAWCSASCGRDRPPDSYFLIFRCNKYKPERTNCKFANLHFLKSWVGRSKCHCSCLGWRTGAARIGLFLLPSHPTL
jgi:hypothetical protein